MFSREDVEDVCLFLKVDFRKKDLKLLNNGKKKKKKVPHFISFVE